MSNKTTSGSEVIDVAIESISASVMSDSIDRKINPETHPVANKKAHELAEYFVDHIGTIEWCDVAWCMDVTTWDVYNEEEE